MHSSSVTPPASCHLADRPLVPPMRLLLLGLLLFVLSAPLCAAATTYYVSLTGNDTNPGTQAAPFLTIQQAINNASSGDTVTLAAGTYTGPGDVDLDMGGKNLTVNSAGGAATTNIDCGGTSTANHRAFYFHSNESAAAISGLTIKNSYEGASDGNGGAIHVSAGCTVTLTSCTFSGNTNIRNYGGVNGGGIGNSGTVTLTNCNFSGNTAGLGGGLSNTGTAMLAGCTLSGNTGSYGGGIYNKGTLTLTSCTSSSNSGDGIYNDGNYIFNDVGITLLNCITNNNSGGGIDNSGGTVTLTNCTLNNNGRGFYSDYRATLTNCTISGNTVTAGNGGGVYSEQNNSNGYLQMTGCTMAGNVATQDSNNHYGVGGGLYNTSPTTTLTDCVISGSTAYSSGGGVYNSSQVTLTNCLVIGNKTTVGNGGGVYNSGTVLLEFCTFAINSASGSSAQGGALENDGTATLTDDILWGNTAPSEAEIGFATTGNPVKTVTYCDIQGGLSGTGNKNADPLFVSPTSDFHLTALSPCLHTGITITGITTDLESKTRANPPSMGCYEIAGLPITNGTTTLASSLTPSLVGQSVTFTATVTELSGNPALAGTVQFTIDGANVNAPVPLSGSGTATATLTTSNLAAGGHPVTATFTPSNPYTGTTSASLTQVVNIPVTVGAMTLASSLNPSLIGQSVMFTATITVTSGSPALAGTVQFASDGVALGGPITIGTSAGHATIGTSTSSLTVGIHHITAAFTSTNAYTGDTSAAINQVVTAISHTHILWNNTDGRVMLWSIAQDGTFTLHGFGPYTDNYVNNSPTNIWHATAVATGADGKSHLLWNNTDGRVMLWTVDDQGNFTLAGYGPYTDNAPQNKWSATAVSVGPDGTVHLLWNNTDHRVMLWNVAPDFSFTFAGYGPYTDNGASNLWSATALATGPDNLSHIAWNNTDGRVMLWNVDPSFSFTLTGYGPYIDSAPGNLWSAVGVSVGPDNLTHLLWGNTDRRAMFWNVDSAFNFTLAGFGPYTDNAPGNLWSATALATGPDNLSHVLWDNTDYRAMLWGVDGAFNFSVAGYGPYTDNGASNLWSATAVSAGP